MRTIKVQRVEVSSSKKLQELNKNFKGGGEKEDGPSISPEMVPLNAISTGKDGRRYKISVHTKEKQWIPTESIEEFKARMKGMTKMLNSPDGFNQMAEKVVGKNHFTKWGSVKYDGAFMAFSLMNILGRYYDDPLAFLGINKELPKATKKGEVVDQFRGFLVNLLREKNADEAIIEKTKKGKSIDALLKLAKPFTSLWRVIKKLFNIVYPNGKINAPKARKGSPDLDPEKQESNNFVGIVAYFLVKEKLIKKDTVFEDFEG